MASQFLNFGSLLHNVTNPHPGSWNIGGVQLPDFGLSEFVQPAYASAPTKAVQGASTSAPASFSSTLQTPSTNSASIIPSSGGQAPSGGGGGGAPLNLTAPSTGAGANQDQILQGLQNAYGASRNAIQAESPILDQQYQGAQTDINNALGQSVQAAQDQKDQLNQTFGNTLKQQLQTYQDLNQQRQGTFSGLGTLDSSAYQDQQFKADQQLAEDKANTGNEQNRELGQVDQALNSYRQQAQSQLGQLAVQYQQGKNAISQALAQNDINSAQAIQSALDQISQRAQDVQNTMANFANQAALLKQQGVNVNTNIGQITGNDYASQVNSLLKGQVANANATYNIPQSATPSGSGYIYNGKFYTQDQLQQLLQSGQATQG